MAKVSRNWLMAVLLGALTSVSALAIPQVGSVERIASPDGAESSLQQYAGELNDARLDVREAATARLVRDETIETEDIVTYVGAQWETLPPEATERFLIAARQRFIANPGAIGIQFGDSPIAIIQTVIDGTPASRVLQRGDQFLTLNGEPLPDSRAMQQPELLKRMAEYKAGDKVKARIRRGSEELDVEFALADPKTLPRFEDFIVQMQREMSQQWDAMCQQRFPPAPRIMIDMGLVQLNPKQESPSAAVGAGEGAQLIDALSRRRVEVSQSIARVMERSSNTDSPERRRELEAEYLPLINEFARLNARLRLAEAVVSGRRRR